MIKINKVFKKTIIAFSAVIVFPAFSAPINFILEGKITNIYISTCTAKVSNSCVNWDFSYVEKTNFYQGLNVVLGDSFTGSVTYDPNFNKKYISDDGFQASNFETIITSYYKVGEISLPSSILPEAQGYFATVNNRSSAYDSSGYDMLLINSSYYQPNWYASSQLGFIDWSGKVFDSLELPVSLKLLDFEYASFTQAFVNVTTGDQMHATGAITSLTFPTVAAVSEIPEPGTSLLLALGLAALAAPTLRSRKS